jgi:hypothetical protein
MLIKSFRDISRKIKFILKGYEDFYTELCLLLIAMLWVALAYAFPFTKYYDIWFARSGSIMVLSAVIVEYRLFKLYMEEISSSIFIVSMKKPLPIFISDEQNSISIVAHIFVVCGTLIWGYGDLLK